METGTRSEDVIPLAIAEEEDIIDTQFIHWGYVNCCLTLCRGKKVKKEKWNSYWLELCGSTLRFYKDSSLNVEASYFPPRASPSFISKENASKVAFFDLKNAGVKLLSDGKFTHSFQKKSKKSDTPHLFRRHLFQLKLRSIHSTYIFQAPSRSSMLRWVSKLQESLDRSNNLEKSGSAEEHLRLAHDIMNRKLKSQVEITDDNNNEDIVEHSELESSDMKDGPGPNPKLNYLRNLLSVKQEQIWQFEMQIIDFLGRGKGEFKRNEFICTTKKDYFLVPGCVETFVPLGTNVIIFGQLPNRRWRCVVERNEQMKSISTLVKTLEVETNVDSDIYTKLVEGKHRDMLQYLLENLPEYPLIGCLPTSILNIIVNNDDKIQHEDTLSIAHSIRDIEITLSECSTDSDPDIYEDDSSIDISLGDLRVNSLDVCQLHSGSESTSETESDISELNKNNPGLRKFSGIVIRKKLRQNGISILVGSSSSDEEENYNINETSDYLNT